ncbi:MAG: CBS domain-containing protein [Gemmatimonadetes bacterium]|nr:CBS domain-containing protein [Gemmatimonadota bacterium]
MRLTVRDIMTRQIQCVSPETPAQEAVEHLIRLGVRALPVVGEKGEVLGIVTDRDIMRSLLPQIPRAAENQPPAVLPLTRQPLVREIMSRSVLCVAEDTGIDEVANLMINKDVGQLPVVREGKLTGFLTRADIIRKLLGR